MKTVVRVGKKTVQRERGQRMGGVCKDVHVWNPSDISLISLSRAWVDILLFLYMFAFERSKLQTMDNNGRIG